MAEIEASCSTGAGQMVPVRITDSGDDHHIVEFTPHACETHRLSVTYGGEPLPGSPFQFDVCTAAAAAAAQNHNNNKNHNGIHSSSSNNNSSSHHNNNQSSSSSVLARNDANAVRAAGTGLEVANRGREATFVVHCPGTPNVQIERVDEPGDRIEPKVKLISGSGAGKGAPPSEWRVTYTVLAVGVYEVRVSCPNRGTLPGSPWRVNGVDTTKVMPVGGWGTHLDADGRLVLPARFVFDISALAGPGELVCTVDGRELGEFGRILFIF